MDRTLESLRDDALDLFNAARAARQYEVAYHALAALLHTGESLEDPGECERVERLAKECRTHIDASQPDSRLSSQQARTRGNESIFRQLGLTAHAARLRIEADAAKQRLKART